MSTVEQVSDVIVYGRGLEFLYKRISMPKGCMTAWLHVPEFVQQIRRMNAEGIKITNEVVLEVAEPILAEKMQHQEENQMYRLQGLRRGLNRLREATEEEAQEIPDAERK